MNCSDVTKFAPLFLTGELEPARARSFSAHVKTCSACGQELGHQAAFDELLRTTLRAERIDSSSIDQRVRVAIRSQAAADPGQRVSRRWILAITGTAAILIVAMLGYLTMLRFRTTPVYAAAARDHRLELVAHQPRKWLTDSASIERLAAGQGVPPSAIGALAPVGYHLAQGKLCFLDGRVFLHVVYADDRGNFSLFLRQPTGVELPGGGEEIRTATLATEHVAGFHKGQFLALVVTGQPGDTVLRLARSAAAAL